MLTYHHQRSEVSILHYTTVQRDVALTPFKVSEKYAYMGERDTASKRAMAVFVLRKEIWILL